MPIREVFGGRLTDYSRLNETVCLKAILFQINKILFSSAIGAMAPNTSHTASPPRIGELDDFKNQFQLSNIFTQNSHFLNFQEFTLSYP